MSRIVETNGPKFSFAEALRGFKKQGKKIVYCSYDMYEMLKLYNPYKDRDKFLKIFFTFHSITCGIPQNLMVEYNV